MGEKIPSLSDRNGKRMSSRGVDVLKEEKELFVSEVPVNGGIMGVDSGKVEDLVIKVEDRKRMSTMVRVMGESGADWIGEALERHGIVLPGGVRATRMMAATESMFHAAIADKNVAAYVALRDSGWGKPKDEVEVSGGGMKEAIPITSEVLVELRKARDVKKEIVVDMKDGGGNVTISNGEAKVDEAT